MGQGTLTNAGRALFAAKQAASQVLVVDRFMLANIPGLVAATAENQNESLKVYANDPTKPLPRIAIILPVEISSSLVNLSPSMVMLQKRNKMVAELLNADI